MANRHQRRMPQFIEAIHEQVSTFARARFQAEGRGVIEATIALGSAPDPEPPRTNFVYHTANAIRRRTADLTGSSRDAADMLLRMIDTYDPTMQAVVIATIGGHNPVSVKVNLAPVRWPGTGAAATSDLLPPYDRMLKRPQGVYR